MLELNLDNIAAYLQEQDWWQDAIIKVESMGWGVSNTTLRIITPTKRFVLKQSQPQLRTKEEWYSDLERVHREAAIMRFLQPILPDHTVPNVIHEDQEQFFFIMSHAPEPSVVWKQSLLAGDTNLNVAEFAGNVLAMIHEQTANHTDLLQLFGDDRVFWQLRINPFYERICQHHPDIESIILPLISQLREIKQAICHGDFSPKNMLVHGVTPPGAFTLVDYETAYYGDPTMDLGFFLSHLCLKAVHRYRQRADYFALIDAFWDNYCQNMHSLPVDPLIPRGIQHLAVCMLARIDGTSPVDYLPQEPKRVAVRAIAKTILHEQPTQWPDVKSIIDQQLAKLDSVSEL